MEVPEGNWYCKHCRDHLPALAEGEEPKTVMYGWGNNHSGCVCPFRWYKTQLGSGIARELISTPTLLTEVQGSIIQCFDVGDVGFISSFHLQETSILVDIKGGVYTCGDGTNGQLGHQDVVHESLDHFRRVDFFQSSKISKGEGQINRVVSSADNMYAITCNGHLYGWGGNSQGELGHMDYKPKRLPKKNSVGDKGISQRQAFREMNVAVMQLVTGDHHALVLSHEPQVYAMGDNTQQVRKSSLRYRRQLGVSNNSLEWTPKMLCQEWKHVLKER